MPLSLALWDRRSLANLIDRAADDLSELTATLIRWWPSTGVQLGDYDLDYHIDIVLEGLGLAEGDRGRMVSTLSGAEKVRAIWTRSRSVWPTLEAQTGTLIDAYREGLPGHWEERKTELLGYGLFACSTYPGLELTVSHDRRFIQRFADEVWELREGTLVRS